MEFNIPSKDYEIAVASAQEKSALNAKISETAMHTIMQQGLPEEEDRYAIGLYHEKDPDNYHFVSEIFYGENGRVIGMNTVPEDEYDLNLNMTIDECIDLAVILILEFDDPLVDRIKILYKNGVSDIPVVKYIVREW
ncbi:hypothetical protein [Macrococcus brunensis]|uniref:hypothetical protein n=1 Tax=Macrococcus brunensis TaxID=198483 RepID=UPI001EEFAF3C|nr:hypothetical protein [Macrococcus brunensis]ULG74651.1 hypothetical protein MGG13_02475 [Macrococcus brunensis]